MAGFVFWAQVAQMCFLGSRSQGQEIFWDFIILLNSSMILEKMRSSLWKLELGFMTNGLISPLPKALGPNYSKLVFRPQMPNVKILGSKIYFMSNSIKFASSKLLFLNFGSFLTKLWVSTPRKLQKSLQKNLLSGAISDMQVLSKSFLKKPRFLEH